MKLANLHPKRLFRPKHHSAPNGGTTPNGVVSVADLEAVLASLGGGGGCMSAEELANRVGSGCEPEEVREAFEVFDEDGDGRISAEELLRVFEAIGDERCTLEECRRMIAGVDSDGDGFVCFQDFSRMMDGGAEVR